MERLFWSVVLAVSIAGLIAVSVTIIEELFNSLRKLSKTDMEGGE